MLTDGISTHDTLIDSFAHKASLAAINGFALWADPNWAGGSERVTQTPLATISKTARAVASPIRCNAVANRAATAAGLLLLLVILWRSLRSIHTNSLVKNPH
jgi:hypothetical protein